MCWRLSDTYMQERDEGLISSRIAGQGELFSLDFQACAQSPRWATRCSFGSVSCSCSCDAAPRTAVRKHHQECPIHLGKFSRMRNNSISKTATAELGRARLACSLINTCAVGPGPDLSSQRCCKLRLTLLVDQLAKKTSKLIVEFVTTKRLVSKNGHSLVEPPSRVFYTVSVSACLFVGERFFQKVYGRPLPSTSPFTLFAR